MTLLSSPSQLPARSRARRDNPAVPITPTEQIESTREAFEAGATLAHIHVRNDDETPSSDPDRFAVVFDGIRTPLPRHDRAVFDGRTGTGPEQPGVAHSF